MKAHNDQVSLLKSHKFVSGGRQMGPQIPKSQCIPLSLQHTTSLANNLVVCATSIFYTWPTLHLVDGPWEINKGCFLVCKTIGQPKLRFWNFCQRFSFLSFLTFEIITSAHFTGWCYRSNWKYSGNLSMTVLYFSIFKIQFKHCSYEAFPDLDGIMFPFPDLF